MKKATKQGIGDILMSDSSHYEVRLNGEATRFASLEQAWAFANELSKYRKFGTTRKIVHVRKNGTAYEILAEVGS